MNEKRSEVGASSLKSLVRAGRYARAAELAREMLGAGMRGEVERFLDELSKAGRHRAAARLADELSGPPERIREIFRRRAYPRLPYARCVDIIRETGFTGGGYVDHTKFDLLCERYNVFQLWNRDYLDALASEIKKRVGGGLVLEVCAGDGILSRELSRRGINVRAVDDMSYGKRPLGYGQRPFRFGKNVEKMGAVAAVRRHGPEMVVASWIPGKTDIDVSVLELGPPHAVFIGSPHESGSGSYERGWRDLIRKARSLGYRVRRLKDVDRFNLCCRDKNVEWLKHGSISRTLLFSRGRPISRPRTVET